MGSRAKRRRRGHSAGWKLCRIQTDRFGGQGRGSRSVAEIKLHERRARPRPCSSSRAVRRVGNSAEFKPIDFGGGHLLRGIRADEWVRNSGLVDGAPPAVINTSVDVDFELSVDNGVTWVAIHVPKLPSSLRVASGDLEDDGVFDTEMLALEISGGSLPAGVMVRESPSKASLGRTSLRLQPDGSYVTPYLDSRIQKAAEQGGTLVAANAVANAAGNQNLAAG